MKLFHKEPKAEQPYAVCVPGQHPKAGDAFRVNIAGEYVVRGKEGESLTARLGKTEGGKPFVVLSHLLCQKEGSDETVVWITNGSEYATDSWHNGSHSSYGTHCTPYFAACAGIGTELRKQIPKEWHEVLGYWLTTKNASRLV